MSYLRFNSNYNINSANVNSLAEFLLSQNTRNRHGILTFLANNGIIFKILMPDISYILIINTV